MSYRIIAQSIATGEFLHWDFPLSEPAITRTLSGPTVITGKLDPEIPGPELAGVYDAWATWLHVEQEGRIRASAILQPTALDDDTLTIGCEGFTAYPHGMPYLGEYSATGVDPLDVVRRIWDHLQSYPDGDLGVMVDATRSPVRIGTKKTEDDPNSGPYELHWWDHVDCGEEINQLAQDTPFDYLEHHQWNADRTDVEHRLVLGYPRVGRRRHDLRFAQGENITSLVPLVETESTYASDVVVTGAGEGRKMVRATASRRVPGRVRRVAMLTDKNIKTTSRAKARAAEELRARGARLSMKEITIDTAHPNAALGTYDVGDDIAVTATFPYLGAQTIWHRITAYTWSPEDTLAVLQLAPSDSYTYGPTGG